MNVKELTAAKHDGVIVAWRDDPDAEYVMQFVDAQWDIQQIKLSQIDWDESANNCARITNPLNAEKIEDYRACMERGDVFPRIVVARSKRGYVILGGNQRCNALKMLYQGRDMSDIVIEAYVIPEVTTSQTEALIRSLNSRHGWGSEKSERIAHAVHLVRSHGLSTNDAARLMVVSKASIDNHIRAENTRASLARRGVDSNRMTQKMLDVLSRISYEDVQTEVGKIVEQFGPSAEDMKSVVDAIERSSSRVKMAGVVKDYAKSLASSVNSEPNKTSKVMGKPRRTKFMRMLEELSAFLERGNDGTGFSTLDELQCSPERDGDKVRLLSKKICLRLNTIVE